MIRDSPKYRWYDTAVSLFLQSCPGLRTGAGQSQCWRAGEEADLSAMLGQVKIRLIWSNDAPSSNHEFTAGEFPFLFPPTVSACQPWHGESVAGHVRWRESCGLCQPVQVQGDLPGRGVPHTCNKQSHAGLGIFVCVCGVHLPDALKGLWRLSASWTVSIAVACFLKWISVGFYLFCQPHDC